MILVTGGAGYIGSHVVRQLSEIKQKVIVIDNLSTGSSSNLLHNEKLIVADLADYSAITQVMEKYSIKTVMHFAASIIVPESINNPIKYYANNTVNTLNLLRACVEYGIKQFIFSSTAAVYGAPEIGVADEATSTMPVHPYGSSKLMAERILADIANAHNMRFVCLRYFNVAGADIFGRIGQRNPAATHLIKIVCQAALGLRDEVPIYGTDFPTADGTGVRDYIHVEDLAAAHLCALNYLASGEPSIIFNVGYGCGASVKQVIDLAKKITGKDFAVIAAPRRPGDPAKLIAKADLIRTVLSWQPQHADLVKIITDSWRWEQSQYFSINS